MGKKFNIGGREVGIDQALFAMIAAAGVILLVGGFLLLQRQSNIAKAKAWTPVAAPCPIEQKPDYLAKGDRAEHVSIYDGIQFGRGYGYVTCDEIRSDGGRGADTTPVCQFNNPTVLRITTAKVETFFVTGIHGATVLVEDGQPRCILAANQKLQ